MAMLRLKIGIKEQAIAGQTSRLIRNQLKRRAGNTKFGPSTTIKPALDPHLPDRLADVFDFGRAECSGVLAMNFDPEGERFNQLFKRRIATR